MRKYFIVLLTVFFATGLIFSASLKITNPKGGELWKIGDMVKITWDSSGLTTTLKLTLYDGSTQIGVIAQGLDNKSVSYSWSAGTLTNGIAPPGTGYSIKIREQKLLTDHSSKIFSLVSPQVTVLKFTNPKGGELWKIGDAVKINWNSSGIKTPLKLDLYSGITQIGVIATGLDKKSVSYSWSAGTLTYGIAPPGSGYTIKAIEQTNPITYTSKPFTLLSAPGTVNNTLEGTFLIDSINYKVSGNKIDMIDITVRYNAKKDFRLCSAPTGKCNIEHGALMVTYELKNFFLKNNNPTPTILSSCIYACINSCGRISYPKETLKAGSNKFKVSIYPKTFNRVHGVVVENQSTNWFPGYSSMNYISPTLKVKLTICTSWFEPPKNYIYKMQSDTKSCLLHSGVPYEKKTTGGSSW